MHKRRPIMLKALREKRAKLIAEMRGILDAAQKDDDRDLTEEESKEYDAKKAEVASLDSRIARLEEQEALEASLSEPEPTVAQRQRPQIHRPGGDPARREFESLGEF